MQGLFKKNWNVFFVLLIGLSLVSCRSNDSSEPVDTNTTRPIAHAGVDQTVRVGRVVTLDGSSDPNGDSLVSAWVFVSKPEGSQVSLNDAGSANPTFVPDKVGDYGVVLTVTDGNENAWDTVTIHVTNTAPVAKASLGSPDVYKKAGDSVVLDGSGSRDDDGDPLTFAWSVVSWVGEQPELTDATSEKATITAGDPGPCGLRLDVSDGYEMDSSFVVLMVFEPTNPVPDTGQTGNYTETFGEDSDYTFHPHSYTRLKTNGEERTGNEPWDADPWLMVRDNVTGLIWEVKGGAGSVNDKMSRYLWADTSPAIAALNSAGYGGYKDWRLPTVKELSTLVHSGRSGDPVIDVAYFPNTQSSGHWSSTSDASYTSDAWRVHFDNGSVDSNGFSAGGDCVRAVRGGQ